MSKHILISAYAFYPSVGGLEEQVYLLSKEWLKAGYSVDVLTEKISPDQSAFEVYEDISIYRIPFVANRTVVDHIKIIFFLSVFILKNRRKYDFCVLRAAITLYPLVFGIWKFLRFITYKTFLTADTGGPNDEITLIRKIPFHRLIYPIYSAHDFYNSSCEDNFTHYKELKIPDDKLTKIPNGIVFSGNEFEAPKRISTFLFLARLFKYKGVHELLLAFKQYHKLFPLDHLVIGGIGPEEEAVKRFITENHLEDVITFYGVVERSDKDYFYSLGDCLVSPSYSEGFGITIIEAMLHRKAIIATDVADLKSNYGSHIHFCKKYDAVDLCRVMRSLKKQYKPSQIQYESLISEYNISDIAAKILDLSN